MPEKQHLLFKSNFTRKKKLARVAVVGGSMIRSRQPASAYARRGFSVVAGNVSSIASVERRRL